MSHTQKIYQVGDFTVWFSEGYNLPWWISDADGAEIEAHPIKDLATARAEHLYESEEEKTSG